MKQAENERGNLPETKLMGLLKKYACIVVCKSEVCGSWFTTHSINTHKEVCVCVNMMNITSLQTLQSVN